MSDSEGPVQEKRKVGRPRKTEGAASAGKPAPIAAKPAATKPAAAIVSPAVPALTAAPVAVAPAKVAPKPAPVVDKVAPKAAPVAPKPVAKAEAPKAAPTPAEPPKIVKAAPVKAAEPAKPVIAKPAPARPAPMAAKPAVAPAPAAPAPKPIEAKEAAPSPAVDSDQSVQVLTVSAVPSDKEGNEDMATIAKPTTPTEAADKAQAMMGDMNARFKTAFEKSSKASEEMVEFAKGNVEAVVASARVAAKHGETIGQEIADYSKKSFESAMAMLKSLASAKSPTELFQLQSDYAKSSFDSAVAEASKLSESMLKIANEVTQPLSSRYALAAEKIKTASL